MCQVIRRLMICSVLVAAIAISVTGALGAGPAVRDDPLVRMPGTQPEQVPPLQSSTVCYPCHGGGLRPWSQVKPNPDLRGRTDYTEYDIFKAWQGSMMGNSARDPLMFACFTVAAQD